ncbi:hypothetical protein HOLleu_37729 [Holothuria leucospilota]|uniref:Uncharacterized protein n=1 Tax=Holothuria leucospilota TaxID=206669 RepID=A0A9Q1BDK1_HOLLE|nr:hypothetical protein HOLleu_37729 [Holothuria leucospilota]
MPVTCSDCGRSFSVLPRLSTDLRASMTEPRLSALAMMHVHYDMDIDLNVVVNLFARYHPEKLRKVHLFFSGQYKSYFKK